MKITGTRSSIQVEIEGKVLTIQGELTTTPAFYADANSIKRWDPPYDDVAIGEVEKTEIINMIKEEAKNAQVKIIFD